MCSRNWASQIDRDRHPASANGRRRAWNEDATGSAGPSDVRSWRGIGAQLQDQSMGLSQPGDLFGKGEIGKAHHLTLLMICPSGFPDPVATIASRVVWFSHADSHATVSDVRCRPGLEDVRVALSVRSDRPDCKTSPRLQARFPCRPPVHEPLRNRSEAPETNRFR